MKNYLEFEKEIKALEQEVDGLKSPFGSEGISEVDTKKINKIQEELNELLDAVIQKDADDIVDALIDIIVVALGTLDAYNINIKKAWNRVHDANMNKMVGHNSTRKNIYNLPDLVTNDV